MNKKGFALVSGTECKISRFCAEVSPRGGRTPHLNSLGFTGGTKTDQPTPLSGPGCQQSDRMLDQPGIQPFPVPRDNNFDLELLKFLRRCGPVFKVGV